MATENRELGFEEGVTWLPSGVLEEAGLRRHQQQQQQPPYIRHPPLKSPARPLPPETKYTTNRRSHHQNPRPGANWTSGGMRALFLEYSGQQRSGGTGVFLPRRAGTNFQPTRKQTAAARSPVLLPSRVVHALNLNVQQLHLQFSHRQECLRSNYEGEKGCPINNKSSNDVSTGQCCVTSQNPDSSAEVFLPKEWTY